MGMYWILSNVFAFLQTLVLGHFYAPRKTVAQHMVAETIERRSHEKAKKAAADKEKNGGKKPGTPDTGAAAQDKRSRWFRKRIWHFSTAQ
jgi:hypothetical protein